MYININMTYHPQVYLTTPMIALQLPSGLCLAPHLSNEMLRVSSWVVTTGAESRAATCSSVGCSAPSPSSPKPPLGPRREDGDDANDDMHSVSQNTSCRSWSTSITTALESEERQPR